MVMMSIRAMVKFGFRSQVSGLRFCLLPPGHGSVFHVAAARFESEGNQLNLLGREHRGLLGSIAGSHLGFTT
jgi:hypothetical protein